MRGKRRNRIKRSPLHRTTKRNPKHVKAYFAALLLLLSVGLLYYGIENALRPVLSEVAQIKVKEMVSIAVNDAVAEKLLDEAEHMDFLSIDVDESGRVSLINANSVYMNKFATELTEIIHHKVGELDGEKVMIPIGSILGSELFSQTGPEINVKVKPIGMAKVDFKTEFDSSGINQTKYKVYLQVTSRAKPLIPFASETVEISSVIPIAETVIVGKVPQTYVSVPGMAGGTFAIGGNNDPQTEDRETSANTVSSDSTFGMAGTSSSGTTNVINGIDLEELD